jgi:hypothetical protein
MPFPCPNCKRPINDPMAVRWFGAENNQAAVYCCSECFIIATRFYNRAAAELKALLDMLKESTRVALTEGRMVFPEAPTKKETLEAILQLKEWSDARKAPK